MSTVLLLSTSFASTNVHSGNRAKFLGISPQISKSLAPRFGSLRECPLTIFQLRLLAFNFYSKTSTFQYAVKLYVYLFDPRNGIEACQIISGLRQLRFLGAGSCTDLNGKAMIHLLPNKEVFPFPTTFSPAISPSFFQSTCLTNLTELDLSFSTISDGGKELAQIICPNAKNLRRLILRHCYGVGVASLKAVATNLKYLEYLDLSYCEDFISFGSLQTLCDPVTSHLCKSLRTLILGDNALVNNKCVIELVCPNLENLTSLDLSHCLGNYQTTSEMASSIVDVEKSVFASSLAEIVLRGIPCDVVKFFSNLLESRKSFGGRAANPLRKLDLSYGQNFFTGLPPPFGIGAVPSKTEAQCELTLNMFRSVFSAPFVFNFLEELILEGTDIIDDVVTSCGLFDFENNNSNARLKFRSLRKVNFDHCTDLTIKSLRQVYEVISNRNCDSSHLEVVSFEKCWMQAQYATVPSCSKIKLSEKGKIVVEV